MKKLYIVATEKDLNKPNVREIIELCAKNDIDVEVVDHISKIPGDLREVSFIEPKEPDIDFVEYLNNSILNHIKVEECANLMKQYEDRRKANKRKQEHYAQKYMMRNYKK